MGGCGLPRGDIVIQTFTARVRRGRRPLYPWQWSTWTIKTEPLKTKVTVCIEMGRLEIAI